MFSLGWRKPRISERIEPAGDTPRRGAKWLCWVIVPDGRVGYIDHYKTDGRFGVRPVQRDSGLHYPHPDRSWPEADRIAYPEELAVEFEYLRAAKMDEVPRMYQR